MKRLSSIRSILILAFTLSLLIPIMLMMLYAYFISSRVLAEQALERQLHEVTLQAQHIEQSLNRIRDDASYLVNVRSLRQLQNVSDTSGVEQDLIIFSAANPMMLRLLYLTENGHSIGIDNSTATPRMIDADVMQGTEYQAFHDQYAALALSQFAVSFDLLWDTPVLRYSLRFDRGVLVIDVLASWVLQNMPDVEANSIWAIINRQGHHLLFPLPAEDFAGALPATDAAIAPYLTNFQNSTSGTFDAGKNTFIYSRIYPTNDTQNYWLLYQQKPQSELYNVVNNFYQTSFLLLLIAIVATLGLSVFISGQIVRPLKNLREKVRDLAQGIPINKLTKLLKINELNELHQSFYQMAEQLNSERGQNRQLIKQLISAQEDERKRIAYDLHDGLIQQLVAAKMYISMLKTDCNDEQVSDLEYSEDALKHAIVEGRRMIEGLHPTILDDLGLVDAIMELANQQAKRYGWTLDLQLETLPYVPDKSTSITVFRIVQEALNNIAKHAQAKQVSIRLSNGDAVKLMIQDDGMGFDMQNESKRAGFGIGTMRERAMSLNGKCHIESTPDTGTSVVVELPYSDYPLEQDTAIQPS